MRVCIGLFRLHVARNGRDGAHIKLRELLCKQDSHRIVHARITINDYRKPVHAPTSFLL